MKLKDKCVRFYKWLSWGAETPAMKVGILHLQDGPYNNGIQSLWRSTVGEGEAKQIRSENFNERRDASTAAKIELPFIKEKCINNISKSTGRIHI